MSDLWYSRGSLSRLDITFTIKPCMLFQMTPLFYYQVGFEEAYKYQGTLINASAWYWCNHPSHCYLFSIKVVGENCIHSLLNYLSNPNKYYICWFAEKSNLALTLRLKLILTIEVLKIDLGFMYYFSFNFEHSFWQF